MFIFIRFLMLFCMACSSVVFAQSPSDPPPPEKKEAGRRAWIVATSLPDGVKSPVTILAGGKLSEVRLSKRSVGKSIKVPKDGKIQLVKPILTEDGETSYEILASAVIPEGMKKALIILVPVADLAPPLKFKTRVIDLDQFRGGNALFANITNLEIGIVLGKKRTVLSKGQIEVIDVGKFTGSKSVPISFYYRKPKEKNWNLISASTVPLRSSLREILIFSYNKQLGIADYHGITLYTGP